jgi:hypothetical protein
MDKKLGRNDPCSCGSGKKYKHCCMLKQTKTGPRKLKATWVNAPKAPNLMDRTYGATLASSEKVFTPVKEKSEES